LKILRNDILDGKDVTLYSYNSTNTTNGVQLKSQTELWVGKADGLPYKMIVNGEVLSASMDPVTGENKLSAAQAISTTDITFDPTITIAAPNP
jgi:hypothetical protein